MSKYAGFQSVELIRPKRSTFDLSHDRRMTTVMGRLTPCLITECVPSDYFNGSSEVLLRLAPLLAPIYDQINLYVHYFFVPNRLLWDEWEEFITGGRLGVGIDPVDAPLPPSFGLEAVWQNYPDRIGKSTLLDYLGAPVFPGDESIYSNLIELDLMPAAAYQLVWYEYYRDRNYVDDDVLDFPLPSGRISAASAEKYLRLRTRAYLHDYFTSALPFTQRGEEVLLPLAGTGSVTYLEESKVRANNPIVNGNITVDTFDSGTLEVPASIGVQFGRIENIDDVILDSSDISINDFRSAYALQVWLERNAIGGSRYTESTQAHFGVKPQDSRLQRPEYIGGGRISVKISEVLSTAWSNDGEGEVPLANMGGYGVTYGNTNQFRYFCAEHGFIIGILSIMNPPSYQNGLPRMFRRRTFLDYPWPTFAKLGEQEVANYEIYADHVSLLPDSETGEYPLFGYQSRYADWKYIANTNHGDFRDNLLFWTLTRNFTSQPVLSQEFVEFDSTTEDRIFAAPMAENFWLYVHNRVSVKRPLPYFGTPNTLNF